VGVGVVVAVPSEQDPSEPCRVYCGIRKGGSHGSGKLALPGGHLEFYESWESCACREVREEMELRIRPSDVRFAHVTNDVMRDEEKHYVTVFMMTRLKKRSRNSSRRDAGSGDDDDDINSVFPEPKNTEPHKCEGWKLFTWQELVNIANSSIGGGDDGAASSASAAAADGVTTTRKGALLFGPLLQLVRDEPPALLQFLNQSK